MTRRATGSGGVTALAPDRHRIRWRDVNGRQRERTIRGSHVEAERALRDELGAVDIGATSPDRESSVADWLEEWLALARPGLSPRSIEQYQRTVHRILVPAFGRRRLVNLHERHLVAAIEMWRADGAGDAAIRWRLNLLRMALGRAVLARRLAVNVGRMVALPPHRRRRPVLPSDADVDRLLALVAGHQYELAYAIAIGTGMRLGEILALRWSDIDLPRRRIAIRLSRIYGTEILKVTKTEAGDRTFVIPTWLATLLAAHRGEADAFIVVTSSRRSTDARNLHRRLHRFCDQAGIPRMNFRAIRHYAITRMLEAGVPMPAVSRAAGHSTIRMTVDVYGHVAPSEAIAAALER
jgi:integrase